MRVRKFLGAVLLMMAAGMAVHGLMTGRILPDPGNPKWWKGVVVLGVMALFGLYLIVEDSEEGRRATPAPRNSDRVLRGMEAALLAGGAIAINELGWSSNLLGGTIAVQLTLILIRCLGFLPGSHCPHYDGEPARRPVYRRLVRTGAIAPGHAADDGVALHYAGRRLHRVVSSRRGARAWRVSRHEGRPIEIGIVPDYLG
jgi:hypothetical protein